MAKHGGARKGAGRKPKHDEQKARERLKRALRIHYGEELDEDAIEKFLIDYLQTKDGMKFFAEHLLGKPTDNIDLSTLGEKLGSTPFEVTVVPPPEK